MPNHAIANYLKSSLGSLTVKGDYAWRLHFQNTCIKVSGCASTPIPQRLIVDIWMKDLIWKSPRVDEKPVMVLELKCKCKGLVKAQL